MKNATTLGRLIVLILLAIPFFASKGVLCQTSQDQSIKPERVTALFVEDIFRIGITTNNLKDLEDATPIDVFADPELSEKIGTIANHTVVRYDRLSVLTGKPYWAAHPANRLPGGEKFKIYSDSITGWIDDVQLMTLSSQWRQRRIDQFFAIDDITTVCLYSSGQYETLISTALTVWEWTSSEDIWVLQTIEYGPVPVSSFSWPAIEGLVRYKDGNLAIQVRARGGDEADRWGSFVFYLYRGTDLIESFTKHYGYRVDRDHTTVDCELILNDKDEPIVHMIQNHFVPDDPNVPGYEPTLSATDTTMVNLLEEATKR
jgi:hypothetical protein